MPRALSTPYDAIDASPVTPSDVTVYSPAFRALYVGGAGAVAITTAGGTDVVFAAVPAGTTLRVAGTKVKATGTVATNIVALF